MRSTAYVCFDCRRAVKGPAFAAPNWRKPKEHPGAAPPPHCPSCAEPMHDLGHRFKAPRKADVKQWQKVRRLFEAGVTFHGYGRMPQTLAEVDAFLASHDPRNNRADGTKQQSRRTRPAKVAKKLSGPTFGPAAPITPPRPRRKPTPVPISQQRAPETLFRKPRRKRPRARPVL